MRRCLFLFAAALIGVFADSHVRAQDTPAPAFDLALTLNDGTTPSVYRGWPFVVRGDAVFMGGGPGTISLELPSLTLSIAPAQGPALRWPLRRVTQFASAPILGPANEAVRVVWLLLAADTVALAPGNYTARWTWAGKTSSAVAFSIVDAPPTLPEGDAIRRTLLQSEAAQLLGDTAGALAALEPMQTRYPEAINLLVQRARVHVQRGEHLEALQATQRALTVFHRDDPKSSHPPVSILEVETEARAELFKAPAAAVPLPGLPVRGTRTVSVPAGQNAAKTPAASVEAGVTPAAAPRVVQRPSAAQTPPSGATARAILPASNTPAPGKIIPAGDLLDAKITADPAGQWAATASAGSFYGSPNYSASRATGVPNVPIAGDSVEAWCPGRQSGGTEWLEVAFARPVRATELRVRQTNLPGALVKVEAIAPDGTAHVWWAGVDPFILPPVAGIAWFAVRVPATDYAVAKVRLTLNLDARPGWKQIDAVQLVAAP